MPPVLIALLNGKELADLVVFAIPLIAMPLLSVRLRRRFAGIDSARIPRLRIYLRSVVSQWLLVACIAVLWWTRGRAPAALGLDIPLSAGGRAGLALVAGLAVVVLAYWTYVLAKLDAAGRGRFLAWLERSKMAPRTGAEAIAFVPVALTAGIGEELLYRGFIFWFLAPTLGLPWTVVISAVVFGLGHGYQGWRGIISTTGTGFFLGAFYAVSGTLWWVMGLHAVIDLQYCVVGQFVARWNRLG
jgi:membrane protease YdiL (CAAX protease family)